MWRSFAVDTTPRSAPTIQICTNDKAHLAEALHREVAHQSALERSHALEPAAQARTPTPRVEHDRSFGLGR